MEQEETGRRTDVDAEHGGTRVAHWPPPAPASLWRRLTQKGAAVWLALAMLAAPGLPLMAAALLPDNMEPADATDGSPFLLATDEGIRVSFAPPPGWFARGTLSSSSFHEGDRHIFIDIIERLDHDPQTVGRRLMRRDAMSGFASAFDGGTLALPALDMEGLTCTLIVEGSVGRCALLANTDIIMLVQTLGSPDMPAIPLEDIVARMGRPDRE